MPEVGNPAGTLAVAVQLKTQLPPAASDAVLLPALHTALGPVNAPILAPLAAVIVSVLAVPATFFGITLVMVTGVLFSTVIAKLAVAF